jgi:hypothetical protein
MSQTTGASDERDFYAFMRGTFADVLLIAVIYWLRGMICRLLGIKPDRTADLIVVTIAGGFPFLLNGLLLPFGLGCSGAATWLLLDVSVLNMLILLFPLSTWARWVRVSASVNAALGNAENQTNLTEWMARRLRFFPQVAIVASGVFIALLATAASQHLTAGRVNFCVSSYVSTAEAGGLGGLNAYWLWSMPLLVKYLCKLPNLRLRWHSPADTPLFPQMTRLLVHATWRTAIGIMLTIIPLLYFYHITIRPAVFLVPFELAVALLGLSTLFIIGVAPHYWLSKLFVVYRERVLEALSINITRLDKGAPANEEKIRKIEPALAVYDSVSGSPSSIISKDIVTMYIAAGITVMLPFAVQFGFHLLHLKV